MAHKHKGGMKPTNTKEKGIGGMPFSHIDNRGKQVKSNAGGDVKSSKSPY